MKTFNTLKEFNKQYNELRNELLIQHGLEGKKARLNGCIALYMSIEGVCDFIKVTSTKTSMTSRIKASEGNDKYKYKLVALQTILK